MKMRNFGKLGIQGSALGLGCMRFPKKEVDGKMVVDEENAINIIRTAIDGGVTYMDTAYVYLDQNLGGDPGQGASGRLPRARHHRHEAAYLDGRKGRGYAALL